MAGNHRTADMGVRHFEAENFDVDIRHCRSDLRNCKSEDDTTLYLLLVISLQPLEWKKQPSQTLDTVRI